MNKILLALILIVVVVLLIYRELPIVKEKSTMQATLVEAEAQRDAAKMQNGRLKMELKRLQLDPDYLGLYVRDLGRGYANPNETVFQFPREGQK